MSDSEPTFSRLALNFKRVPFDIVWVHFPDVEHVAKSLGAPHTRLYPDGSKAYTVPFITFEYPDREKIVISGSDEIARYLDSAFPEPERTLFPKETLVFQHAFTQYLRRNIARVFLDVNITAIHDALPPHTRQWWIDTRPRAFGASYEHFAPNTPEKREKAWKRYEEAFDELEKYLDAAGEGNYRLSNGLVTYAEIEMVALLKTIQLIGKDDGWKGLKDRNGGRWAKLVDEPEFRHVTSTASAKL